IRAPGPMRTLLASYLAMLRITGDIRRLSPFVSQASATSNRAGGSVRGVHTANDLEQADSNCHRVISFATTLVVPAEPHAVNLPCVGPTRTSVRGRAEGPPATYTTQGTRPRHRADRIRLRVACRCALRNGDSEA